MGFRPIGSPDDAEVTMSEDVQLQEVENPYARYGMQMLKGAAMGVPRLLDTATAAFRTPSEETLAGYGVKPLKGYEPVQSPAEYLAGPTGFAGQMQDVVGGLAQKLGYDPSTLETQGFGERVAERFGEGLPFIPAGMMGGASALGGAARAAASAAGGETARTAAEQLGYGDLVQSGADLVGSLILPAGLNYIKDHGARLPSGALHKEIKKEASQLYEQSKELGKDVRIIGDELPNEIERLRKDIRSAAPAKPAPIIKKINDLEKNATVVYDKDALQSVWQDIGKAQQQLTGEDSTQLRKTLQYVRNKLAKGIATGEDMIKQSDLGDMEKAVKTKIKGLPRNQQTVANRYLKALKDIEEKSYDAEQLVKFKQQLNDEYKLFQFGENETLKKHYNELHKTVNNALRNTPNTEFNELYKTADELHSFNAASGMFTKLMGGDKFKEVAMKFPTLSEALQGLFGPLVAGGLGAMQFGGKAGALAGGVTGLGLHEIKYLKRIMENPATKEVFNTFIRSLNEGNQGAALQAFAQLGKASGEEEIIKEEIIETPRKGYRPIG